MQVLDVWVEVGWKYFKFIHDQTHFQEANYFYHNEYCVYFVLFYQWKEHK